MQMTTTVDVLFGLMVALCVALVVYGGWLCWGEARWGDENDRRFGPQTAPLVQPRAGAIHATGSPVVQEPVISVRYELSFLYFYAALAIMAYTLFAPTDGAPAGLPVSSAAATEGTRRTEAGTPAMREGAAMQLRASLDAVPAYDVEQGRGGDGNVMTYEHD